MYLEWTEGVDDIAKANLDKPLIVRNPSTLHISVNFDPQVDYTKEYSIICHVLNVNA